MKTCVRVCYCGARVNQNYVCTCESKICSKIISLLFSTGKYIASTDRYYFLSPVLSEEVYISVMAIHTVQKRAL